MNIFNSREFNRHTGRADKTALEALLALDAPNAADMDFKIPPRSTAQRPPVDLEIAG